jgi:hypothetical protein
MRTGSRTALIAFVALAVLAPAYARASPIDVIRDCSEDGVLNHRYSQRDLSGALNQLPSDLDEYTNCRSVIRNAQLAGGRRKGHKGALGLVDTRTPATPDEQRQLDQGSRNPNAVNIGGQRLRPGEGGAAIAAGFGTDLPTSVVLVLVLLGLSMLAGAGFGLQRRWPHAWAVTTGTVARPLQRIGRIGRLARRGISRLRR